MFKRKDKTGPPYLGSLLSADGVHRPIKRKLQLKKLKFVDDNLTMEMNLVDFERKKFAYESAERTIVFIEAEFEKGVHVEVKMHDLVLVNFDTREAQIKHAGIASKYVSVPVRNFQEFLKSKNTNDYVDVYLQEFHDAVGLSNKLKSFMEQEVMKMKIEKSSTIARNIDDVNKIVTSLSKYLINKCNKLTDDWISQTRFIINDIFTARDKLRYVKKQLESGLRQTLSTNQFENSEIRLEAIDIIRDKYVKLYKNKEQYRGSMYVKLDEDNCIQQDKGSVTVLLLGTVGCGKTTLINSLANYFKYSSMEEAVVNPVTVLSMEFSVVDSNNRSAVIRCGDKRITRDFTHHNFTWNGRNVKLIDTPGFNKTTQQYSTNIDYYLKDSVIDVVCIVVDSQEGDVELLRHFLIQASKYLKSGKEIVFCYTKTADCFYNTGQYFTMFIDLLKETQVNVVTNRENVFCLDNEPYRYLCALKYIKFQNMEVDKFRKSWNVSCVEAKRLFDHICSPRSRLTQRIREPSQSTSQTSSVKSDRSNKFSRFFFLADKRTKTPRIDAGDETVKPSALFNLKSRRHSLGSMVRSNKKSNIRIEIKPPSVKSEKINNRTSIAGRSEHRKSKNTDTINILVVGPRGSGKTTLINSIINYIQFENLTDAEGNVISVLLTSFTITGDNKQSMTIKCGDDDSSDVCNFVFNDSLYRMIDTPGFFSTKLKNVYLRELNRCTNNTKISHVCVVLSCAHSNWNDYLTLLPNLQEISNNIILCLTHTGYDWHQINAKKESLSTFCKKDSIYCVDSESYKYLCSLEFVTYSHEDKCKFAECWTKSSLETKRMLLDVKKPKIKKMKNKINIAVVGPSGSGKSTLINSFLNYITYNNLDEAEKNVLTGVGGEFKMAVSNRRPVKIECEKNKIDTCIRYNNLTYNFIDTPGFDVKDSDNYMCKLQKQVSGLTVNVLCIVLKAHEQNPEPLLTSFIKQIPNFHLITQNILFCFTHCSDNLYTNGGILPLVMNHMKEMGAPVTVSSELVYCFNNDNYRYLCALKKLNFSQHEVKNFIKSWCKSREEARRMLDVCVKFQKRLTTHADNREEKEFDLAVIKSYITVFVPHIVNLLKTVSSLVTARNKLKFSTLARAKSAKHLVKKTVHALVHIEPVYICINHTCPNACIQSLKNDVIELKVLKSQHCKMNLLTKLTNCSSCNCPVKDHIEVNQFVHKQQLELTIDSTDTVDDKNSKLQSELDQQIELKHEEIRKIIDDVSNLNNYLKTVESEQFIDELNVKLTSVLEDTTLNNPTYMEEIITAKQYYERTSQVISGCEITNNYLKGLDKIVKEITQPLIILDDKA